jgi:hypothetical protein
MRFGAHLPLADLGQGVPGRPRSCARTCARRLGPATRPWRRTITSFGVVHGWIARLPWRACSARLVVSPSPPAGLADGPAPGRARQSPVRLRGPGRGSDRRRSRPGFLRRRSPCGRRRFRGALVALRRGAEADPRPGQGRAAPTGAPLPGRCGATSATTSRRSTTSSATCSAPSSSAIRTSCASSCLSAPLRTASSCSAATRGRERAGSCCVRYAGDSGLVEPLRRARDATGAMS